MDEPQRVKTLKRAEELRKKPGKFWGLFYKPDYLGSADLFADLAAKAIVAGEKEQLYCEAANTLLMGKTHYNYFRAAEIYRKLRDIFVNAGDMEKIKKYSLLYSANMENAGKFMMAGQALVDLAVRCEESDRSDAILYYKEAYRLFELDGLCPFHMKKANERCLALQLQKKDYSGALETLSGLELRYSCLCKQLLMLICDQNGIEELEDINENRLLMTVLNKTGIEAIKALEQFSADNFLPDYAQAIFKAAIEKYDPVNDIC